ncbi:MAG: quinoprotein dehydrogenase-associated putative ABC transporter substrate-binding protein [Acidobacteriaceae bacterium]|nr:quinoprotein dehydrogenase-associated putative ABC transporter substrate-binding protein [Acidobacteriaceae bacterium]
MLLTTGLTAAATPELRVCADPNNLPYSNDQRQGFENRLANLIGNDLAEQISYTWYPQRGKFFRKTLEAGVCDVVMGVPEGLEEALETRPYYRSTYVFVSRQDRNLHIASLDDPQLRTLRIGVHILGEANDSLPPVHALLNRGVVRNLVGFSIFGNLTETNPAADLIQAVINKSVDLAVAWGPLAGYFSLNSQIPLTLTPINRDPANPSLPFAFDIAMGVRPGNDALRRQLDAELTRRAPEIRALLHSYGIPQTEQ